VRHGRAGQVSAPRSRKNEACALAAICARARRRAKLGRELGARQRAGRRAATKVPPRNDLRGARTNSWSTRWVHTNNHIIR
jgi:hypothetical protein